MPNLLRKVDDHGLKPQDVILEITESVALLDLNYESKRLHELHDAGFSIAVDDFGTGYSSLSQLHRMPVDILKIDTSFTSRLDTEDGRRIVQAIVQMADALNLMIEHGDYFRVERIETWLDAGTPESLFETNRYLLQNGYANRNEDDGNNGVAIIPPAFIHPSAEVISSVIGPNVSIGANCRLENVVIRNAIVDEETQIKDQVLKDSLLGRSVNIEGQAASLNVGDNTSWVMK